MKFELLKKYYGYDTYRPGQEKVVDALFQGQDALVLMPTGGGKSICYQMPAMMSEGTAIVISPLIALMKDQVDGLCQMGIPATYINSTLSWEETLERYDALRSGETKIVYVAPERLLVDSFIDLCRQLGISLIAVDEAHCISQWGHDFRPSYRDIPKFIDQLSVRPPIGAFTATATAIVVDEIRQLLHMASPVEVHTGFDRSNLFYKVIKPKDKLKFVQTYLKERPEEDSGIIYCSTRKSVESLAGKLKAKGISAQGYHGGMDADKRSQVQDDFMRDHTKVIVATNAFGMGIDKPDIRYVLHFNMPKNMESYYQEAGRAGRDGEPGECLLMYSPSDIVKQKFIISQNEMTPERETVQLENLQYLINYCHSDECLRKEILAYFGEEAQEENCGNCGNCNEEAEYVDLTVDAQKIISCVVRLRQRYGIKMVIQVLRGSKNQRLLQLGLDQVSTYGLLKDYSEGALREIIMNLIARGYLYLTADQYPVLRLTPNAQPVLKGEEKILIKQERAQIKDTAKSKGRRSKSVKGVDMDYDEALYELLAVKRSELAEAAGIARFMVFANATLAEMAYYKPMDEDSMLDIKGIGENKLDKYGKEFLGIIKSYVE